MGMEMEGMSEKKFQKKLGRTMKESYFCMGEGILTC